jgi:hypothetical protein
MVSEGLEEGSVAPLEFSDGVMEQVEAMAKELRSISGGIWALVEGVGKLTEAVVGLGKKEGRKEDKETETETEGVQRMDKQTEMEKREDESKEEEESEEEEEKEDDGKEDGEQKMEETEKD